MIIAENLKNELGPDEYRIIEYYVDAASEALESGNKTLAKCTLEDAIAVMVGNSEFTAAGKIRDCIAAYC